VVNDASSSKSRTKFLGTKNEFRAPKSLQDGLRQAYESIANGILRTGNKIVAVPVESFKSKGLSQAMISLLKGVPGIVLDPTIVITEALGKTIQGMKTVVESKPQSFPLEKEDQDDDDDDDDNEEVDHDDNDDEKDENDMTNQR
jgi:hypothetical protein